MGTIEKQNFFLPIANLENFRSAITTMKKKYTNIDKLVILTPHATIFEVSFTRELRVEVYFHLFTAYETARITSNYTIK